MKNNKVVQETHIIDKINKQIDYDVKYWDSHAQEYEDHIVQGHPDIVAYEKFELSLIDKVIGEISKKENKPVRIIDICSGTGRLAEYYLAKSDSDLPGNLAGIHGLDFSTKAVEIAQSKLEKYSDNKIEVTFETKSAFDFSLKDDNSIPVLVNLNNAIGSLQGPDGAQQLFRKMKETLRGTKGIAIISCFLREYIEQYALNHYESTMQVSGQPSWLEPNNYASPENTVISKQLKTKGNTSTEILCDIYDKNNELIREDVKLTRSNTKTRAVVITGNIKTHLGYSAMWYSDSILQQWIKQFWGNDNTRHVYTRDLDSENAEFGQLAIIDSENYLDKLF